VKVMSGGNLSSAPIPVGSPGLGMMRMQGLGPLPAAEDLLGFIEGRHPARRPQPQPTPNLAGQPL
jgi:hypothetical protein